MQPLHFDTKDHVLYLVILRLNNLHNIRIKGISKEGRCLEKRKRKLK